MDIFLKNVTSPPAEVYLEDLGLTIDPSSQVLVNDGTTNSLFSLAQLQSSQDVQRETTASPATIVWVFDTEEIDPEQAQSILASGADYGRRPTVLAVVDNTAAPPTEVDGARYLLDFTGGGVHADWDGALAGDIVQYSATGGVWTSKRPVEGWVVYNDDDNCDWIYEDDGTPVWTCRATAHAHTNLSILNQITDEGSGDIITTAERNDLHAHSNKAQLDLVTDGDHDVRTDNPHATDVGNLGSGTVSELNTIITDATIDGHTHSNKTELDLVSDGDHDVRTDNPHGVTSAQASYNNATSGLTATDAQAAIDEIEGRTDTLEGDTHSHANKVQLDLVTDGDHDVRTDNPHGVDVDDLADFVGDAGSGGTHGLVPAPVTGDAIKLLRGDGQWVSPAVGSDEKVGVTSNDTTPSHLIDKLSATTPVTLTEVNDGGNETFDIDVDDLIGDSGAGGTRGLAPAPGAGDSAAGKYLCADATWAVPVGTGGDMLAATYDPTAVAGDVFDADNHVYSNAVSGLTATDVQAAIDEIEGRTDTLEGDTHTHSNKAQLDLVTDGDHDVRTDNPHGVTAAQAGALATGLKGAANGVAELDGGGKVPSAQLPSYVDDVEEYANLAAFPVTGETGKIYVALDTDKIYRWTGSVYVEISADAGAPVSSVFTRTGAVVAASGDYNGSQVDFTPAVLTDWNGDADPGQVDDALDQLAERTDDLEADTHTHSNKAQLDLVTDGDHDVRTDNPHATDLGNIGSGTVAELNTAVTDATIDGHTHSNKVQLDLVTDGDHDVRTDNPHGVDVDDLADMVGATGGTPGTHGLVPAPAAGEQVEFLRGDGTWAAPSGAGDMLKATYDPANVNGDAFDADNHVYSNATSGLTATDVQAAIDEIEGRTDTLEGVSHTIYSHPNHSGDVTSVGDGAQTIASDAVTYAKMQNVVADDVLLGNVAGAGGVVAELSASTVKTLLDLAGTNSGDEIQATETLLGIAEIATTAEVTTATDDLRFVTPLKLGKGQVNGVASLDGGGKVPAAQLPSYVDDVLEYANLAAFPGTGETGKIYVAIDTGKIYRWTGSVYVEISADAGAPVTSVFSRTGVVVAASGDYNGSQVDYTPAVLTDWDGDADPGQVDDALDQLAQRADDLEADSHVIYSHPNHSGDVTSVGDGVQTIANDAVTNAKAANMPAYTLKGNDTGATADPDDLTVAEAQALLNVEDGANAYVHPNHTGEVTSTGDGATVIAADVVDNTNLSNMAQATIKGRQSGAGTGDPEDLTAAQARTILNVDDGANAYVHPNHTGDVTSVADGATTIANNVVTNAKLADVATQTFKGRTTAATGDPEDLTATQARAILNVTDGATKGVQTEDEGTLIDADATVLNFAGAGVTATDAGSGETLITIPGAGSAKSTLTISALRNSSNAGDGDVLAPGGVNSASETPAVIPFAGTITYISAAIADTFSGGETWSIEVEINDSVVGSLTLTSSANASKVYGSFSYSVSAGDCVRFIVGTLTGTSNINYPHVLMTVLED